MRFAATLCTYNPNHDWYYDATRGLWGLFDQVIVVDDGSDKPAPFVPGCTFIRNHKNMGLRRSRNIAIAAADADIICHFNDDDQFIADGVVQMQKFVEDHYLEADIFTHNLVKFGDEEGIYDPTHNINQLHEFNTIPAFSWFKKEVWFEVGGFTWDKAEDWDFWWKAKEAGKRFMFVDIQLYKYRIRSGGLSSGWVGNEFIKLRDELREMHQWQG